MKLKYDLRVDRSTVILLGTGVCLVFFIIVFLLIPGIRQYGSMTAEYPQLQEQLKELRELKMITQNLEKKIRDIRAAVPEHARMEAAEKDIAADQVIGRIEQIAQNANVQVRDSRSEVLMDPSAEGQRLKLSSAFHGRLDNLRVFLLHLLQQPYIRELSRLSIESGGDGFLLRVDFVVEIS